MFDVSPRQEAGLPGARAYLRGDPMFISPPTSQISRGTAQEEQLEVQMGPSSQLRKTVSNLSDICTKEVLRGCPVGSTVLGPV